MKFFASSSALFIALAAQSFAAPIMDASSGSLYKRQRPLGRSASMPAKSSTAKTSAVSTPKVATSSSILQSRPIIDVPSSAPAHAAPAAPAAPAAKASKSEKLERSTNAANGVIGTATSLVGLGTSIAELAGTGQGANNHGGAGQGGAPDLSHLSKP